MNIGIYAIVNTLNGNHYIGQTIDLKRRQREHTTLLTRGSHPTRHLQHAWTKHGEDAFMFVILCHTTRNAEEMFERETFWMTECRNRGIILYNVSPSARSSLGIKRSDEYRRNSSESRKGKPQPEKRNISFSKTMKGRPKPESWKQLMKTRRRGTFQKGLTPWNKGKTGYTFSDEAKQRMSEARKKMFAAMSFEERKQFSQRMRP